MRAFVLLCLLHAVFGQDVFSWDPPGQNLNPDNAGSACKTDQGSCGCCMMLRETDRLKTYLNARLNDLEKAYLKMNQSLTNVKASRIAFSVALHDEVRFKCFGPFDVNRVMIYKRVFLNLGNGYSTKTGIFTVPRSGVYSLALTVYSDAGAANNTLAACAGLQVNGNVVAGSRDVNKYDQEDSSTIVVILSLKNGDQVAVNLPIGCFLCDDPSPYNTFSAFLLYSTA